MLVIGVRTIPDAAEAIERRMGARGLRTIIEEIMLDVMFDVPSEDDIAGCTISAETVTERRPPELRRDAESARGRRQKTA